MTAPRRMRTLYPRPWTIERVSNYATVRDATKQPIPMLSDIELGWTDTSTGPYHDPDSEYEELESIVVAVNAYKRTA